MEFSGKVVLITGAGSGIGAASAIHFAKLGASLSLTGRKIENLNEIVEQCTLRTLLHDEQNYLKPHLTIAADVTDENEAKRIIDETIKHFGRIDVLVNSAGVFEMGTIETSTLAQYDRVMGTNMRALYYITQLAVPYLIEARGSIVNVSSVNGIRAFAGVLMYNLSKAAVDQFTRCVALELASKHVRVNSVNPGVIETDFQKKNGGMTKEQYDAFLIHSKSTHALGRVGQVQEVAEVIAFLASEKAAFITGANIPVDGGRHALCPR